MRHIGGRSPQWGEREPAPLHRDAQGWCMPATGLCEPDPLPLPLMVEQQTRRPQKPLPSGVQVRLLLSGQCEDFGIEKGLPN